MEIVLVRHGETLENQKGIIQGQTPGELSELGKQQAQTVAQQLKDEQFDAIYSSDLKRCTDTAEIIRKQQPKLNVETTPELREISYGRFEGIRIGIIAKPLQNLNIGLLFKAHVPGLESFKVFSSRLEDFLNQAYKKYPNGKVLVVTHGGPIRVIRTLLENNHKRIFWTPVKNCSVWRVNMSSTFQKSSQR